MAAVFRSDSRAHANDGRAALHMQGPDSRTRLSRGMFAAILGALLWLTATTPCQAERLSQVLTPKDLSRPILLDQNGQELMLPSTFDPHPVPPVGSTPTYMIFGLHGGEHLPAGITTIPVNPADSTGAVGPLDFNRTIQSELTATLSRSGMALVKTPGETYFVEFVPSQRPSTAAAADGSALGAITNPLAAYPGINHWLATLGLASTGGGAGASSGSSTTATSSATVTTNSVTNWINSVPSKLLSWTNNGLSDLEKMLGLKHSSAVAHRRATASKPSLNLEAQVLGPPPTPIPEPGTWLCFGIILGGIVARRIQIRDRTNQEE